MGWEIERTGPDGQSTRRGLPVGTSWIGRGQDGILGMVDETADVVRACIVHRKDGSVLLVPEAGAVVEVEGRATTAARPLKAGATFKIDSISFSLVQTADRDADAGGPPTAATRFVRAEDVSRLVANDQERPFDDAEKLYDLQEVISDGGQAVIYRARDRRDGSLAAIKLFKAFDHDPEAEQWFQSEVDILSTLHHPNIVSFLGAIAVEDEWGSLRRGLVMEHLDGVTLKEWIVRHPRGTPWNEARPILDQCLQGLEAAHEHGGVIHRDLKPSNIFIQSDGTVKLIDFGLAHVRGRKSSTGGGIQGSYNYLAPEYARGEANFTGDVVSDIFGLFACFYELLTGRLPFPKFGDRPDLEFLSRWREKPPSISHAHMAFRAVAHLSKFIDKGLHPDRKARFASYAEVREALQGVHNRLIVHGSVQYELLDGLGSGAFGEVFKAQRKQDLALVAIKRLFPDRSGDAFAKEARILSRAHYDGIVRYLDFFQGGGDYYLVMEYLEGMPGASLRDRIRANPKGLPLAEVVPAFLAYAAALGQLHYKGIIHRDIKPANLYAPEGAPARACIMDLGVARDLSGTKTTGTVPGSWDYMAPELLSGNHRGSPRSDLYALGLSLYEALTGGPALPRLPRDDREAYPELIARANGKSQHSISFADGQFEVYPEMARLLRKVCAGLPADRPRDCRDFFDALLAFGSNRLDLNPAEWTERAPPAMPEADPDTAPVAGAASGGPNRAQAPRKRGRRLGAAALAVAVIGGAIAWGWPRWPLPKEIKDTSGAGLALPPVAPIPPAVPEVLAPEARIEPVAPVPPQNDRVIEAIVREIEDLHRFSPAFFDYESFKKAIFQRIRELDELRARPAYSALAGQTDVLAALQRFWTKVCEWALLQVEEERSLLYGAVAREGLYQLWLLAGNSLPPTSVSGAQQMRDLLTAGPAASLRGRSWPLCPTQILSFVDSTNLFLDHLYAHPAASHSRARVLPTVARLKLETTDPSRRVERCAVMDFNLVPDGVFEAGAQKIELLDPIYFATAETTVEAMRIYRDDAVRLADAHRELFSGRIDPISVQGEDSVPYAGATVDQAVEFCNWLSVRARVPPVYGRAPNGGWMADLAQPGFRLPTIEEWEYAARLGIDFAAMEGQASWQEMELRLKDTGLVHFYYETAPRASENSPAYPLGLRDLCGNVHEICMVLPADARPSDASSVNFATKGGAANSRATPPVMPDGRPGSVDDIGGMIGFRVVFSVPFAHLPGEGILGGEK